MERIFNNNSNGYGILSNIPSSGDDDHDQYVYSVRALIADSVDYEESQLSPDREMALDFYYGKRPALTADDDDPITGDPPLDDDTVNTRSSVVSTDVRDTVLAIMPSLMRIFAGSEHAIEFEANTEADVEMAAQATDYVRYKLWHSNDGFMVIYGALWDGLTTKVGVVTWGTSIDKKVSEKTFEMLTQDELTKILNEKELEPEVLHYDPPMNVPGIGPVIKNARIKYVKSVPQTWVEGVPPEDFRISRNAKSAKTANLVGYEQTKRISDLIEMGYDPDLVMEHSGITPDWSIDRDIRNPGGDTNYPLNDLVRYGCFWVRVDKDGDGINELREIHTIGENYEIIEDEIADSAPIALFGPDPRPHTAIGGSMSDLVLDIQKIKTNLLRGGLDSLAQSIFPRSVFNELLTNAEDVMSDDIGAAIRTRGDPASAVYAFTTPFVGKDTFDAASYLDGVRASRTGISDASKGLDPRALQSTNVSGIDAIVSGAQERIELIARILAETGFKDLYTGLLQEIHNNPNRSETIRLRGKWVPVDPSLYDADMKATVNPSLGKGSDQTRLMALQGIAAAQVQVVEKFGMGNGAVGPIEMRNTQVDIMALVNIKDASRYFRVITPEQAKAMETAPKDPDAATLLAQSAMEKNKVDMTKAISKQGLDEKKQEDHQALEEKKVSAQITKAQQDDDFRRDKLNVDSFVALEQIAAQGILADVEAQEEEVKSMNK